MRPAIPIALAALAVPALAGAQPAPAPAVPTGETAIPFASRDIQQWAVDRNSDRGVYLRAISGKWYYARTASACRRMKDGYALGFETQGDQLDRFGTIIVQGWRCPLESVTRSDGPPKKAGRTR